MRKEFDSMFDSFVARQSFLARGAMAGKREEIWGLVRTYFEDAGRWRAHCRKLAEEERLRDLGM